MNVDILSPSGKAAGSVELPGELFDVQVNVPLIHQVVVAQLAAARQGTHDTKSRGEVRGGGRKPYKQKGTGRARQGSTRAPQFTGGGVVHGPTPRDYAQRTPKKMKAAALRGALSDRARNGRVHVVSAIVDSDIPSAKAAASALAAISERPNLLVVVGREDIVGWKSLRNLANVHPLVVDQLNTYDVLCSDDVVFTAEALQTYIDSRPATASAAPTVAAKVGKAAKAAAEVVEEQAAEVKAEVAEKAAELKAEVVEKVAEVKAEVAEKVAEAKAEVAEKVAEVKAEVAEKRAEAKSAKAAAAAKEVLAEEAPVAKAPVAAAAATAAAAEVGEAEVGEAEVGEAEATEAAVEPTAVKAATDEEVDQ